MVFGDCGTIEVRILCLFCRVNISGVNISRVNKANLNKAKLVEPQVGMRRSKLCGGGSMEDGR